MWYPWLKTFHIISSTVLFGVGLGSAFYKFWADRKQEVAPIVFANRTVVLVDWLFVAPSVIIQPVTGVLMVQMTGFHLTDKWLFLAICLYLFAGACWLVAVRLQIQMRKLSESALLKNVHLPLFYFRLVRYWIWLGIAGFIAVLLIFPLMVIKPH